MSFGLSETIPSTGDTSRQALGPFLLAGLFAAIGVPLLVLPEEVVPQFIGAGLLLAAAAAVWAGLRTLRIARRLAPGLLDVPHTTFYLGSQVPARFRRPVKHGPTDADCQAVLVHKEWVRYTVGTDTRTATRDVQAFPLAFRPIPDGQHVTGELTLAFPAYPPSFEANNNKVTWELRVDLTFPDGFTEDSVIPLWVVPAIRRDDADRLGT